MLPTSTDDDVIQKPVCVVDRAKVLAGLPATESWRAWSIGISARTSRSAFGGHGGRCRRSVGTSSLDTSGDPRLHQQSTYAPDGAYRWMASPAIDRAGNVAIGYSFGRATHFTGQRFAARLASDRGAS
jgi:hypothetical protein